MFAKCSRSILNLLFPQDCLVCGVHSDEALPLCTKCERKIVTPGDHYCVRCGCRRSIPLSETQQHLDCPICRNIKYRFKKIIALGQYENDLRLLVLQMKTQKNGFLASAFANLLRKHRLPELENAPTDMIVPVPMFWRQRLTRGVNPAELLANELGNLLNKPVECIVKKNRETLTQHFLSAKDRIENVRDAFSVRQTHQTGWLPNCWSRWWRPNIDIRGKNILLVDDVITTGSTCNEVSCVLLKNGVKSVVAVAVARTA